MPDREEPCETLLKGLVERIELGEYRDKNGHRLKMHTAFVAAQAFVGRQVKEKAAVRDHMVRMLRQAIQGA